MNYHYIVTIMPVFSEESVKRAITNQNLTWLKNGELTRPPLTFRNPYIL
jgi:hypothetical protein